MRVRIERGGPICDFDRTVTPMVDIVFQLLVFFVLASGGRIAEQTLATSLDGGAVASPDLKTAARPKHEIWLHLQRDIARSQTSLRLNTRPCADLAALGQSLHELPAPAADTSVILDVRENVPLGDVIGVYDACRASGIATINFAASPDELQKVRQN